MSSTSDLSSTSDVVIRVRDLTMGYEGTPVLERLSFTVERGDVFCVLGGSGCGKSTLLRHLIGLARPMSGDIWIEGIGAPALTSGPPRLGVLFQAGALFGSMTIGENVALALRKWTDLPPDAIAALVRAKLSLVGLAGFEGRMPAELSGGQRKRAGIARALALEPPLLFLDELSAGLDPVTAVQLDELILTLAQSLDMTMVIVTHELDSIFKIGRHCIMLDGESRSIIATGDPRELRDTSRDERVASFFNRRVPRED